MLVAALARQPPALRARPSPRALWRALLLVGLGALLLILLVLLPYLGRSTELVRLRNALLLAPGPALTPAAFAWRAETPPADFVQEARDGNPLFVQAVQQLQLNTLASDWQRVLTISQHLLSHPQLRGSPIQSGLDQTYQRILQDGTGYCGDFTRVFMALALASGMSVRAWSFSLDGFGGHGHIWPEVWNRQLQQWQMVDIFNNYYVARVDGLALSALDLRQALDRADPALRLLPLAPDARPGFAERARAWDYYRSGLPAWSMSWGNAVFSYDQALLVRSLEPLSHVLAQLGGLAQGASPRIRVLADTRSSSELVALQRLGWQLRAVAAVSVLALVLVLGLAAVGLWRQRGWGRAGP